MTNKKVIVNRPSQLSTRKQFVGKTRMLTGAAMLSAVALLQPLLDVLLVV